jgi:hypothetical protein
MRLGVFRRLSSGRTMYSVGIFAEDDLTPTTHGEWSELNMQVKYRPADQTYVQWLKQVQAERSRERDH